MDISKLDTSSVDLAPVRGALIVLEGLDRSGKTTQVQILAEKLKEQGRKVEVLRFPGALARLSTAALARDSQ